MKRILFMLLAVFTLTAANAQKNYSKELDAYVMAYADVHGFSGNILVAQKGKIIYEKFLGQANREWQVANTADSRFLIGSLTKQFTAAAILQLEEKGKLSTEDKISRFFPDFPNGDRITLHMLLNHTSGLKSDSGDSEPDVYKINPNIPIEELKDILINIFKNTPLEFEPGTSWRYSNSGYVLLGYIIEQVSGETYRDYMYKNILQKAGMANTDLSSQSAIIPNFAFGYSLTPEFGWRKAKTTPFNTGFSVGGLYSTTHDLLKWNEALVSGKIISKKSFDKMHAPNHGQFGAGYGIFVGESYDHHKMFDHQGALEGYNTFMARYPDDELCIIVLTNKDTNLDFLPKTLAAIMFDKKIVIPTKRMPVKVSNNLIGLYQGTYEGPELPFPLNVVEKDNKLYLRMHRDVELVPQSDNKFYINEPDVEIQIEFKEEKGKPSSIASFIAAGVKSEGKRKV